ncbi:hypothetical protein SLS53_009065 [Cytospora paraplurivora]|uniref:Trichodiene synthase n=1 Tax=Cytospora paraplurivora TaxID=2898453 RepID=A0AAN9TWL0_9PEZI
MKSFLSATMPPTMCQIFTKLLGRRQSMPLSKALRPLITSFTRDVGYMQPTKINYTSLSEAVKKRAALTGVPFLPGGDDHSSKCLKTGLIITTNAYAGHPIEVQVYIATFTWLVCVIDDVAASMRPELERFQERFYSNESQPNPLLQALADVFKETYLHYENIVANFIIVSSLSFVTASVLEVRPEFENLKPTKGGQNWPYYVRDKGGLPEAYGYMVWPKALYPDVGQFLEAIYDIGVYINLTNDILSFYKEELAQDKTNYVSLRAGYAGKDSIPALKDTIRDCVAAFRRASIVFEGRDTYAAAWKTFAMGYITFHLTNPRYRLAEFGLWAPAMA